MSSQAKRRLESEEELDEKENINILPTKVNKRKKARFEDDEDFSDSDVSIMSQETDLKIPDEAEVGVVEMVSVVNFMCHVKLEVRLGANVNFVIGRNGSGKSAILTALIVGLGGKANMTHRGNSLKGFIKEGCNFCIISITLRNRGTDAYKNEEYGDSILIERRLTKDGTGSYKIKNQKTGRLVSNKRDELLNILDQFNIQIDNPVSILTQDTARSFLNTSDKKDKYTFFLKATQLEQMSSDYQEIMTEKTLIRDTLDKKKAIIPELHEEVKVYEEKYKDMQQLQDMKKKIKELKQHLAWALVKEKKEEAEQSLKIVTTRENRLPAIEKAIEETKKKEEEYVEIANLKKEEVNALTEEVQQLDSEKQRLAEVAQKKKKDLKYAQESVKKIQKDVNSTQRDKRILSDEIDNLRNSAQRDYEAEQQEREQQISVKKGELQQIQSQLSTSQHHMNQIKEAISRGEHKKYNMSRDVNDANKAVNSLRSKLSELQASEGNSLLAYGQNAVGIAKAIDEAHNQRRFHQKPIGPLGSMIKLKDKKWAIAVEQCLGGTIGAYACHDNHDMLLLKQIFKKNSRGNMPAIVVCKFADHLFDVSRNKPQNYTAVMDALVIENHIVANTLIDQCRIESVLLFDNAVEAQNVIWQERPPSVKALTKEGHQILGGRSSQYYPSNKTSARYLQVDIGASIRHCEEELIKAQRHHRDLKEQETALQQEITRDKNEKNLTHKKCMAEQDVINAIEMELQELNNYEAEKPPDVAALEAELEEYEVKLKTFTENIEIQKRQVQQITNEYHAEYTVYNEFVDKLQAKLDEFEKLGNESDDLDNKVNEVKSHILHYEGKLNESLLKINKAKKDHEALQKEYELNHSQAKLYCEEVEVKEAPNKLQSKIAAKQKRIDREESSRGKCEEIVEKYQQVLKRYQETKELIEQHQRFLRCIEKALDRRARRYEKFQKSLTDRARLHFDMLLSQRGYVGKMRINHEEETLTIQVNVENAKGASTKDSKSLSGGERSFSTICFIMALWDAMEAPFRCLDEFDVFMDMLNRRISMDMLLQVAKEQRTRQFILLTPQDMSNVAGNERVRIFKLTDPERGQTALPYQPA